MDLLLDPIFLARVQFAWTISFHIIFPSLSIGLASYLAVLEGLYLLTKQEAYLTTFKYWLNIFAMTFGMGVVSGLVMSYEFGTNWSVFAEKTGPVLGPLLGYEVLTAFFLEAGFLGVMLFGLNRVGPKLHFASTCVVAVGTIISAFWILSVNSWMQTPAGYSINELGQFIPASWLEIIFNPSFPFRFAHMIIAAYLSTAFIVGATGAYHLLKNNKNASARLMFSMAMWMAAIIAPLQIFIGDLHGLNTLEHQPAKVAAMEGHYESHDGAPLYLFGIPNTAEKRLDYAVGIPKLGSLILKHDPNAHMAGLDAFPQEDWAPVGVVFWSFRIMVGLGLLMALTGALSLLLRWRGTLYSSNLMHKWVVLMAPSGLIAVLAGWFVTEVGRQPFTVYGLMRTSESVAPIATPGVLTSLIAIVVVYLLVFGVGTYYMVKMMAQTPANVPSPTKLITLKTPLRSAGLLGMFTQRKQK